MTANNVTHMTTTDILDAMRAGDCLHVRAVKTAYGAPTAGLAAGGAVPLGAALRAIQSHYVHECYDGDGKCFVYG